MENIFVSLYSFIPLIGLCGYLPQIRTLFYSKSGAESISLSTWTLWMGTWMISLGYGIFSLQDFLFSSTCVMNIIGHSTIIAMVIYKRHKYTYQVRAGLMDMA